MLDDTHISHLTFYSTWKKREIIVPIFFGWIDGLCSGGTRVDSEKKKFVFKKANQNKVAKYS